MKSARIILSLLILSFFSGAAFAQAPEATAPGGTSGLPIPRFVSFKAGDVNMRTGPGTRYPIKWVYKREDLPVEIVEEYEHWRKIRDDEGTTGWVHKGMVQGKRYVIVREDKLVLRDDPELDAAPMVRVGKGVVGQLLKCKLEWCRVQIEGRKGWAKKTALWGVYPQEVIE